MTAPERRRPRFQFTIRQLLKLILGCGLLSAYFIPAARSGPSEFNMVFASQLLALPMVLGVPVMLLARRGPRKHWLLTLLFLPYAAGFAALCGLAVGVSLISLLRDRRAIPGLLPFVPLSLVFGWGTLWMTRQLIPARCPNCRRLALLTDPSANAYPHRPDRHRICISCDRRFRWTRGAPWEPSDEHR